MFFRFPLRPLWRRLQHLRRLETAAKHFATETNLVLVAVEADRLGGALRWEPSRGGQLFPHLYRRLQLDETVWDRSLPLGATGHIFPEGLI